tara:strand:- start:1319 stop:1429 length:111 start_codon:yes stop_codon:yes gene_type:complete
VIVLNEILAESKELEEIILKNKKTIESVSDLYKTIY